MTATSAATDADTPAGSGKRLTYKDVISAQEYASSHFFLHLQIAAANLCSKRVARHAPLRPGKGLNSMLSAGPRK
jgi:hypothetical protein